jgi:hypothetical protein
MKDKRSLYIGQLVNHYRLKSYFDSVESYQVNYRYENDKEPRFLYFHHNEGLDAIMTYIRDLEKKVDELQYVERIIKAAKENHYERI